MNYLKLKALAIYLNVDFGKLQIKRYSHCLFRYECHFFFVVLSHMEFNNSDFRDNKGIKQIIVGSKKYYICKLEYLNWDKEKETVTLNSVGDVIKNDI